MDDRAHKAWLDFVSRATALTARYSMRDLDEFLRIANSDWPEFRGLIREYLRLADTSQSKVAFRPPMSLRRQEGETHLFDLLRSKKLFPTNADLASFAGRIFPDLDQKRFDKMSRADIAARVVEFLETLDRPRRHRLEQSMRSALLATPTDRRLHKDSFFSKWETIIRRGDL